MVKGARVYTGAYSVAAVLHVRPAHPAARKARSGRNSTRHLVKSRAAAAHRKAASVRTKAIAKRSSASSSVEVAFTVPRTSTTTFNGTTLRTAIASVRPRVGTFTRSRRVSKRVTIAVIPNRTRAIMPRHTMTTTSRATTWVAVPRPPSTPIKKHTPVVRTSAPLPPAPPALPTRAATTVQSAPTPRSTQQSTPIIVRPIVASQSSTGAPAIPASTSPTPITYVAHQPTPTTALPVSRPTSPASTPTPVQTKSQGHSEHPDHPVHPIHPVHPMHP
jgi:hypothetical protein